MFQIDEKVVKDSRTLITIQGKKHEIDHLTKNGTIHYTMQDDNLWFTTPKVRRAYVQRNGIDEAYDKIVVARNGSDIDASYNFLKAMTFSDNIDMKKDLVVRGNLTVEGETTVIDTPSLSIEDNIIELNKNEIGQGISLKNSGTAINRGTKDFARYLFSDTDKAFVLDTNNEINADIKDNSWVIKAYAENNGEYAQGEVRAKHRFTAPYGKFTDSLSVANNTTLNNLIANGTTNLRGNSTTANLTVNGSLVANNTSEFNGLLTANKVSTFNDNLVTNSLLHVKGNSTFDKKAVLNKGIDVNEGATITGETNINGALTVFENVELKKDLSVSSQVTTENLTVEGFTNTNNLMVDNDAVINGSVLIKGEAEFKGNSQIKGNATIDNDLEVKGQSTLDGNVHIKQALNVRGPLNVKDNVTIESDATIQGNTTMNGNLTVEGTKVTANNIELNNNVTLSNNSESGIAFWKNQSYKIYMSSSNDANGGRLDTTSDYNMYFRMSGGTNRGFVFKGNNTPIFQIENNGLVRAANKIISKGYDVLTRENEGHKSDSTGIDADKLDGLHATNFLRRNTNTDTTGTIDFKTDGQAIKLNGASIYKQGAIVLKTDDIVNNGVKVISENNVEVLEVKDSGIKFKTNIVWHKGNDGSGSGLDADLLDGKHASSFALSTHNHDDRYIRNDEVDLKGKYRIQYDEEYDCLDFMYIGDIQ